MLQFIPNEISLCFEISAPMFMETNTFSEQNMTAARFMQEFLNRSSFLVVVDFFF